jgi:hypothetical protein
MEQDYINWFFCEIRVACAKSRCRKRDYVREPAACGTFKPHAKAGPRIFDQTTSARLNPAACYEEPWRFTRKLDTESLIKHPWPIGPRIVNALKHHVIHTNMICNIDHNVVSDEVHRLPIYWMTQNRCSSKIAYAPSIVGVLELELRRNSICSKHCRGPGTKAPAK